MSCKNSKCFDFVLVQATHIVQKAESLFHATENQNMTPIQQRMVVYIRLCLFPTTPP